MINRKPKELAPKLWIDALIFLSAYYPLFAILLIQNIGSKTKGWPVFHLDSGLYVSPLALVLFILSSGACLFIAWLMRRLLIWQEGGKCVQVKHCIQVHGDMLNYTLPFLIGLFAFNYQSWQSITSLAVFLLFMFGFVRRDKVTLLNPMFLLLGIRLYRVEYREVGAENIYERRMLCLGELTPSDERLYLKENAGIHFIFLEKERKESTV